MEQNGLIRGKATNGDKKGSQWVFWCIQVRTSSLFTSPHFPLSCQDIDVSYLPELLPSFRKKIFLTVPPTLTSTFHPQDPSQTATPEELSTLDTSISTLRETTLPSLRTQLKTLTTKLQAIRAEPATCDLRVLVDELSAENARKRGRLEELSGMVASGKHISYTVLYT
jgi:26S proteasome regulatory subunit (ATPase 3-interacting protein)